MKSSPKIFYKYAKDRQAWSNIRSSILRWIPFLIHLTWVAGILSAEDTFESKDMKETVKERLNQTQESGL